MKAIITALYFIIISALIPLFNDTLNNFDGHELCALLQHRS